MAPVEAGSGGPDPPVRHHHATPRTPNSWWRCPWVSPVFHPRHLLSRLFFFFCLISPQTHSPIVLLRDLNLQFAAEERGKLKAAAVPGFPTAGEDTLRHVHTLLETPCETHNQTSLKWYSTIAVLSGTLAPAGTFLKNNDKICPAD